MGHGEGRNDGAIGLGFVSQGAQSDRRGVAMDSRDHAAHRIEQQIRLAFHQPAAKNDQVRVKNRYEVRHRYAHHGEGLFEDGAGLAVSLARRLKDEPGVALFSQGRALSFGGRAEDFAARGGVINFYVEGGKLRFEISNDSAKLQKLRVSSDLLKLARIVSSAK